MTERKPQDVEIADEDEPGFSIPEVKSDMRFFLKDQHGLPKVSVDHLLAQFVAVAKQDLEDKSLPVVLGELTENIRLKRGDHSPMYLAIREYARSNNATVRDSLMPPEPQYAKTSDTPPARANENAGPVDEASTEVAQAVDGVFSSQEENSAVRKLPDVMNMTVTEAIRTFFPSMADVVVPTVRMKLIQGATPEEAGTPYWKANYLIELIQKFPNLAADLDKLGVSIDSAAGLLFARGQKEASKAEAQRLERRGRLDTLSGVRVDDLHRIVAGEVALAKAKKLSLRPDSLPAQVPDAPAVGEPIQTTAADPSESEMRPKDQGLPGGDIEDDDVDMHSRKTSVPDEAPNSRETVTNEDELEKAIAEAKGPDLQNDIATVRVDTKDVRAYLTTVQMRAVEKSSVGEEPAPVPHEEVTTDEGEKEPKERSGIVDKIKGLLG